MTIRKPVYFVQDISIRLFTFPQFERFESEWCTLYREVGVLHAGKAFFPVYFEQALGVLRASI